MPNWTSFNIPISAYTAADSGTILLSAYNAGPTTVPYGNSVLNVDNLNFDNLITTGISEIGETGDVSIYPNPADEKLTIAFADNAGRQIDLAVFNTFGQQVFAQKIYNNTETIDISHFAKGIYFARLTSGSQTLYNKKIIITK